MKQQGESFVMYLYAVLLTFTAVALLVLLFYELGRRDGRVCEYQRLKRAGVTMRRAEPLPFPRVAPAPKALPPAQRDHQHPAEIRLRPLGRAPRMAQERT